MTERYMPIEICTRKVTADEATANKVVFTMPHVVKGCIAQITTVTTHAVYATGLTVEIKVDATTGACTVEVSGTDLNANDIVTLLAVA